MNPPAIISWLLWPLSLFYGAYVRLRAIAYRRNWLSRKKLDEIVVSVGNLTTGGTGKTPTVLWLALRAAAAGRRVGVLTRGYRSEGQTDRAGRPRSDEAALLRERFAGRAQLGVGADRYANGSVLARHGVNWFVLDDGFQHLRIRRDVDIVLLDATAPFGNGRLIPAGPMREPRSALARADVILITRTDRSPALESVVRHYTDAPLFYGRAAMEGLYRAPQRKVILPQQEWSRARFFAFAGIGNPGAFFDDLERWGVPLAGTRAYRDHHRFTERDVSSLDRAAAAAGADALVCTEKDVFNLRDIRFEGLPVYAARIDLELSDAEGFWQTVCRIAERRRGGAAQ
ncbi:MAG TPA: tetraacyldisaccharide 4'-kinase [Methylomirabilota bacterium]|nr:tetraacyldisaccharide 4'-kinase [Methylomirabilota bacterium]